MSDTRDNQQVLKIIRAVPEFMLCIAVLISLCWTIYRFYSDGYLPQPFIFVPYDTFMDWFNPGYWSKRSGAYDIWKSVYPPLSFVIIDVFTLDKCYASGSVPARDCDWYGLISILLCYLSCVVLAWMSFYKNDPKTALFRGLAFGLGFPLLFTLERGNLLMFGLLFFILAHGPLTIWPILRHISIAATVNLKPYLVLPVLAAGIKRQWRFAELAAISTIFVYLASLAYVGAGTPAQILGNMTDYLKYASADAFGQMFYATSYAPFLEIDASGFPIRQFIGSRTLDAIAYWVPVAIMSSVAISALALAACWLQPNAVPKNRIALILILTFLIYQSPGGYALIFPTFLVFLEKWQRPGPIIAIISSYILMLSFDYILTPFGGFYGPSWLSGYGVRNSFGVAVGQFARPGLAIIILWALSLDTITQVILAHKRYRPSLGLVSQDTPPLKLITIARE